jgi:hypothetical protein
MTSTTPAYFWWFKRLSIAMAVWLALLLVARLALGWYADRQMETQLAAVKAAGGPTTWDELNGPPIPDSENAIVAWGKLFATMAPPDSPRSSANEYDHFMLVDGSPARARWTADAKAFVAANPSFYATARSNRAFKLARGAPIGPPPLSFVRGSYNGLREVMNGILDGAMLSHLQGDDREAFARIGDALSLGSALDSDRTLIGQLVGIGIHHAITSTTVAVASDLKLADGSAAGVDRAVIQQLISHFLNDEPLRQRLNDALLADVLFMDQMEPYPKSWMVKPIARLDAARLVRAYISLSQNGKLPADLHDETLLKSIRNTTLPRSSPSVNRRALLRPWTRDGDMGGRLRFLETRDRLRAEQYAAAISLAVRLYHHDHQTWPSNLTQLVPVYLPAVPIDPFGDGLQTMGYAVIKAALTDGGDRPLVYFRLDAEDGVHYRTDRPTYEYTWGDGSINPSSKQLRMGQARDIARWNPKPRTATTQPAAKPVP